MSKELSQKDFDEYYNHWLMKTTSAVCRMTKLSQMNAVKLIRLCHGKTRNNEIYSVLESFGIPRTSSIAREFMNYWNYADSDERC